MVPAHRLSPNNDPPDDKNCYQVGAVTVVSNILFAVALQASNTMSKQQPLLSISGAESDLWPNLFDEAREMLEGGLSPE